MFTFKFNRNSIFESSDDVVLLDVGQTFRNQWLDLVEELVLLKGGSHRMEMVPQQPSGVVSDKSEDHLVRRHDVSQVFFRVNLVMN